MKCIAWVVALGLLSGCSLTYTEIGIPVPEADGLEIGRSTKPDVLEALGPPRLVRRQFDGELYTWRRTKSRRRSITIVPIYVRAAREFSEASGDAWRPKRATADACPARAGRLRPGHGRAQ